MAGCARLEPKDLSNASVLSAMTSMALCPWVAWRPVLTGDLERTSWSRCPSHYFIHSFTKHGEEPDLHRPVWGEGDEEDPLHPVDMCLQKM